MAIDKTLLLTDLRYIIAEDPVAIVHKGDSFNGVKQALREIIIYDELGKKVDVEFGFVAPIADFNTTPETGQDVTIAGTRYNIAQVDKAHCDVAYRVLVRKSYNPEA